MPSLKNDFLIQRHLIPLEKRGAYCFSSNDYLGLAKHPHVVAAAIQGVNALGWGSTGSRLLSGDRQVFHDLEQALAAFKHTEAALVFGGGYPMNVGVVAAVVGVGDVIFADRLVHASVLDGARLSGARLFRYRHLDMAHLEALLAKNRSGYKRALIVTESVFSMDGDIAPLDRLIGLKQQYHAVLMVDEAHAVGVMGVGGVGCVSATMARDVDLIVGTMGKAMGGVGGFLACTRAWRAFFVQTARSLIFSTAMPPASAYAALAALEIISHESRGSEVLLKAVRFREELKTLGYDVLGETHIVPIVLYCELKTKAASDYLLAQGMDVPMIQYPTVPKNQARLRVSMTYLHTPEMIQSLVSAFKMYKEKV